MKNKLEFIVLQLEDRIEKHSVIKDYVDWFCHRKDINLHYEHYSQSDEFRESINQRVNDGTLGDVNIVLIDYLVKRRFTGKIVKELRDAGYEGLIIITG